MKRYLKRYFKNRIYRSVARYLFIVAFGTVSGFLSLTFLDKLPFSVPGIDGYGLATAQIVRVVDGDTIVVSQSGEEKTVRLIGIDTPESVNPDESLNSQEGVVASDWLKGYLNEGQNIYLEYDKEKEDKYGRTLAYVWMNGEVTTSSFEDFKLYNLNAIIVQNTYCDTVYYPPNGKYKTWLEDLDR